MKTFEDTLFEPNHIKRFSEISMSKGEVKTKFGDLIKQLQELVLHLFNNNNVAEISCKISSVYNSENDEWVDGIILPDGEFSKLNLKNLADLLKQRRKILPCKIKFTNDKGMKMKEPVVNGYIKFLHPKTDKINEPNMPWENKSEKKSIVKKFDEYVNELLASSDNFSNDIESTYFVIYKDKVYIFDYTDKDFIQKTAKFFHFLIDEGVIDETGRIKYYINNLDFDSANDFFSTFLNNPKIVSGTFYINKFNKKIPNDVIIAEFHMNKYRDIRISDVLKKFIKFLPFLEYFEIEKVIYHRDDIIKEFGKNFNSQIKIPKILYHGTSSEFISDILKKGIIPSSKNSIFQIENKDYIYLTTSFNIAEFYSNASTARDYNLKTSEVVLEIDSNRIDKDKIVFDYDFYRHFVGKGNKIFNQIAKNFGVEPDENSKLSYTNKFDKNMGGEFAKFGYDGIILPTKINKIHFKTYEGWKVFTVTEFKEFMKTTKMK
jgi:hypothetical protein